MNRNHIEISQALERIGLIHEHMAKGEMFRGYRSLPMALSGLGGIAAALLQPRFVASVADAQGFVRYWVVAGIACMLIAASEILWNYAVRADARTRRCTRLVTGLMVPCLLAGTGVTIALSRDLFTVALLPGLWAVLFSLGVFSTRPYQPRATGWVGLWYMCAGIFLLADYAAPSALSGWRVGGVFGVGQLASALVLFWNLERKNGVKPETW